MSRMLKHAIVIILVITIFEMIIAIILVSLLFTHRILVLRTLI